jgi:hypothetical protein
VLSARTIQPEVGLDPLEPAPGIGGESIELRFESVEPLLEPAEPQCEDADIHLERIELGLQAIQALPRRDLVLRDPSDLGLDVLQQHGNASVFF